MTRYCKRRAGIGAAAICATYVSTIVGAGFASGQEVLRFFTHFGPRGLAGLAVATVLLSLAGTAIMIESRRSRARAHGDLLAWLGGPWFCRFYDLVITAFLFGTTGVMIAGSGALLQQQFGLPSIVGDLLLTLVTVATVLTGLRGVVAASGVVAPCLLVSVAVVAAVAISDGALQGEIWRVWWRPEEAASSSWLLSACLYASYNLILAPSVLTPLAAQAHSGRSVVLGGALGGLLLGLAATCVDLSILSALPSSAAFEAPVLYVTASFTGWPGRVLWPIVGVVLWAEIYTTAVGLLYGWALRCSGGTTPGTGGREGAGFRRWVLAGGGGALLAARAGFSDMVTALYPLAGYAGLLFLAVTLYRLWRPPRPQANGPAVLASQAKRAP